MDSRKLSSFVHKPPFVLIVLTLIAIVGFWGVGRLVHRYNARQQRLAVQLFKQGEFFRGSHQPKLAVASLRAALTYDPENYQYGLSLAEALAQAGVDDEAQSYLLSLWEREPQNGEVNLQLARMEARQAQINGAVRYYHNAMYGIWSADADAHRRATRFELIDVLLQHSQTQQAESELIALAAILPPDPAQHLQTADLFARAGDYRSALRQYQEVLSLERRNGPALLGAGQTAFQIEEYRTAQRYLQAAKQAGALDPQGERHLEVANLILEYDPFQRRLSTEERHRRVAAAFRQAEQRLQACAQAKNVDLNVKPAAAPLPRLQAEWLKLQPRFRGGRFRGNFETVDQAMDLVFRIERQAQQECGSPQAFDQALLLLVNTREGSER